MIQTIAYNSIDGGQSANSVAQKTENDTELEFTIWRKKKQLGKD